MQDAIGWSGDKATRRAAASWADDRWRERSRRKGGGRGRRGILCWCRVREGVKEPSDGEGCSAVRCGRLSTKESSTGWLGCAAVPRLRRRMTAMQMLRVDGGGDVIMGRQTGVAGEYMYVGKEAAADVGRQAGGQADYVVCM